MTEDNNIENSLIPLGSTGIVRVSKSLAITQRILNEIELRIDPLYWWKTLNDDIKILFFANLKYSEEIKKVFEGKILYSKFLEDQLKSIYNLDIETIKYLDIETIKSILQLKFLYVSEFNLSNLIPALKDLTNLTKFYLRTIEKLDISPLTTLTNLTVLDLGYNKISDIRPLTKLTKLTVLHLDMNEISDITPLATLTNLTVLSLWVNKISDISPLTKLTNLTYLELGRNQISDISPLASLFNLTYLRLDHNKISVIRPLEPLTNLTILYLQNNQISDQQKDYLRNKLPILF